MGMLVLWRFQWQTGQRWERRRYSWMHYRQNECRQVLQMGYTNKSEQIGHINGEPTSMGSIEVQIKSYILVQYQSSSSERMLILQSFLPFQLGRYILWKFFCTESLNTFRTLSEVISKYFCISDIGTPSSSSFSCFLHIYCRLSTLLYFSLYEHIFQKTSAATVFILRLLSYPTLFSVSSISSIALSQACAIFLFLQTRLMRWIAFISGTKSIFPLSAELSLQTISVQAFMVILSCFMMLQFMKQLPFSKQALQREQAAVLVIEMDRS